MFKNKYRLCGQADGDQPEEQFGGNCLSNSIRNAVQECQQNLFPVHKEYKRNPDFIFQFMCCDIGVTPRSLFSNLINAVPLQNGNDVLQNSFLNRSSTAGRPDTQHVVAVADPPSFLYLVFRIYTLNNVYQQEE